ncbi:MAG TPA: acetyltransferase [Gemmatimonadales bacterium]
MAVRVRPARTDERERLLELWERSVRATHQFLGQDDIATLRPLVARELAGGAVQWWVLASDDDVPMGFLGYTPDTIEALFLDPDHRGRGGGTLLVAHAQALSGRALAVDVNEQNPAARGFYEALGFAVAGRSALDSGGRPFPILHLKRPAPD